MTIDELIEEAWSCAELKGHHRGRNSLDRDDTLVRLCLIHTEVSEAAQIVKRHGVITDEHRRAVLTELADVMIRVADLAGCLSMPSLPFARVLSEKLAANRRRPYLYGTPLEGEGGRPTPGGGS
jgi:NTP pyrophosphatase (non-canonical NTP hydrolase)